MATDEMIGAGVTASVILVAGRGSGDATGEGGSAGVTMYGAVSAATDFHFAIPNCVSPPSDNTIRAMDFVHMRNDRVFLMVVSPEA